MFTGLRLGNLLNKFDRDINILAHVIFYLPDQQVRICLRIILIFHNFNCNRIFFDNYFQDDLIIIKDKLQELLIGYNSV